MTSIVPQPAPRRLLPPLELEVMKSLWEMENATVGQTQAHLRATRLLAYTTVLTLLDRLAKKGAVRREKQGRGYVYSPVLTRDDALVVALDRLMHDFFEDFPGTAARLFGESPTDCRRPLGNATDRLGAALVLGFKSSRI